MLGFSSQLVNKNCMETSMIYRKNGLHFCWLCEVNTRLITKILTSFSSFILKPLTAAAFRSRVI